MAVVVGVVLHTAASCHPREVACVDGVHKAADSKDLRGSHEVAGGSRMTDAAGNLEAGSHAFLGDPGDRVQTEELPHRCPCLHRLPSTPLRRFYRPSHQLCPAHLPPPQHQTERLRSLPLAPAPAWHAHPTGSLLLAPPRGRLPAGEGQAEVGVGPQEAVDHPWDVQMVVVEAPFAHDVRHPCDRPSAAHGP
eukprot:scaffold1042_cov401-Prasinococcus_capsulatus_cf.AAC.54